MTSHNRSKAELFAELDELAAMPEGWDSYGAPPIHPNAIRDAKRFIEAGLDVDYIIPTSTGCLALQWRNVNDPEALTIELDDDSIDDGVDLWTQPLELFVVALNAAIAAVKSEAKK